MLYTVISSDCLFIMDLLMKSEQEDIKLKEKFLNDLVKRITEENKYFLEFPDDESVGLEKF